ncbi:MAG: hypothetical protein FWB86_09855 [Treponema sp.]|nr:hypothetical protein [Treponema sp.]MCL2252305.1 hypothetical protein [Treponema sp.]
MAKIEFKRVDLGDGVVYEGEIENGKRFVFGKYSQGTVTYIGEFNEESDMEGIGKLTLDNEELQLVSVGTFKGIGSNGLPILNGYGAIYYFFKGPKPKEVGDIKFEEGKFVDGQLHGQGIIHYDDGGKYEGGFANGRMHGKGIRTNADGITTSREYDNGKFIL